MSQQSDESVADPLLRPDSGPRDVYGAPVRAPLGNSIRTLLVFALLLLVGVGVWWFRRPADLTDRIGGREWVIIEADGEPATNERGLVSTFVLDGTGEVRGAVDCNVATGRWSYDAARGSLELDWTTQTTMGCPDDWPATFLPVPGELRVDGAELRVTGAAGSMVAVALGEHEPIELSEFDGSWMAGGAAVEIGRRGRFDVDTCVGEWAADVEPAIVVTMDEIQRDDCTLAPHWQHESPVVPVVHGDSLYLRHDRPIFPLDREIVRLDPAER